MAEQIYRSSGKIGNNQADVGLGDMTTVAVDAYVVPEFKGAASFGGVGGAVARAGASAGLNAYQNYIDQIRTLDFGEAIVTASGGGNARKLIHVVTAGAAGEEEPESAIVQRGFYNALKAAEKDGLKSIAVPALGTGIIGSLTAEQSAKAMMAAMDEFAQEGGKVNVVFVVYGRANSPQSNPDFQAFVTVRDKEHYLDAVHETGRKGFDPEAFVDGLNEGVQTEGRFRGTSPTFQNPADIAARYGTRKPAAAPETEETDALAIQQSDNSALRPQANPKRYILVETRHADIVGNILTAQVGKILHRDDVRLERLEFEKDGQKLTAFSAADYGFNFGFVEKGMLASIGIASKDGAFDFTAGHYEVYGDFDSTPVTDRYTIKQNALKLAKHLELLVSDIDITSAHKGKTVTAAGTPIEYPSEYPMDDTRYVLVHPDDAVAAADALSKSISRWYKSDVTAANNGKLPVHIYEVEVNGKPVALLCSGDEKFYFGIGESGVVPNAYLLGLDMRALDQENHGFFAGTRDHLQQVADRLYNGRSLPEGSKALPNGQHSLPDSTATPGDDVKGAQGREERGLPPEEHGKA